MSLGDARTTIIGKLISADKKVGASGYAYVTGKILRITTSQGKTYENVYPFFMGKGGDHVPGLVNLTVIMEARIKTEEKTSREGNPFTDLTLSAISVDAFGVVPARSSQAAPAAKKPPVNWDDV